MTTPALPEGYAEVLVELKERVRSSRLRAVRKVNTELLGLYWEIGRTILERQTLGGWGAKVIDRLAKDLRAEFPGMTGLSRSNLHYMRSFAEAWPNGVVPQPVGQLGWGHVRTLLDKLDDQPTRDWYAAAAAEEGWSRNVLLNMIMGQLHRRISAAPSNFEDALPATQTDLARELTKDPYIFDFLAQTRPRLERDLEQALVERMQETLTEFGSGFAFVGRQVHFEVDGDDFSAADAAGFESGLHSLALGVELATHDALRILGEGSRAPLANGSSEDGETDLEAGVRLLSEAGRALDPVPGDVAGVSALVVSIADLVLEAGDAGRATR